MEKDSIRLQKLLAGHGIASRRASAAVVRSGRVTVNGKPATGPGMRVKPGQDSIALDGKILTPRIPSHRTLAFYKPRGYVCSTSGQGSPTIYELLPELGERLVPVGRLDKDSEGLLIMTSDGALANRLMHPSFGHRKVYQVTVAGHVSPALLEQLCRPIEIDGKMTEPIQAESIPIAGEPGRAILRFTMAEGRNRQIRRLCRRSGLTVHRLVRSDFGQVTLDDLRPGQWYDLSAGQIQRLLA